MNMWELKIQPAASTQAGLGAWAWSVCYQDLLATGTTTNWIKAILGISTQTAPLLKGRKAFVLMLGCLLSRLGTSPAGELRIPGLSQDQSLPGIPELLEALPQFWLWEVDRVPNSLGAALKWEIKPKNEAELEATPCCSYFWIMQNPTSHI